MGSTHRFPIGSSKWLADVFSDGPSRKVQGRSRPTQRFLTLDHRGQIQYAEGGSASKARSLLETMQNAGPVSRFKLEPFTLTRGEHGVDSTPDILFQTNDQTAYVVEVKSSRFLTQTKLQKCREVEAALAGSGLQYLLWTDSWPLPPSVWRLMLEMRRLGYSDVTSQSLKDVSTAIAARPQTVVELRGQGIYREHILAAGWHGLAHFELFEQFSDHTVVGCDVQARGFSRVLTSSVNAQTWWESLPSAATSMVQAAISGDVVRRESSHA